MALKFINKLTDKAMNAGLKKVQKDAEKVVGKTEAKKLVTGLKEIAAEDSAFQKQLKQVNNTGKAAVIISTALGAGAIAAPYVVGAGTTTAVSGGTAVSAAGAGAKVLGGQSKSGLLERGIVPGDNDKKIVDQILDEGKDYGRGELDKLISGDEGTPPVYDDGPNFNLPENGDDKKGIFEGNTVAIFAIVIILILMMSK